MKSSRSPSEKSYVSLPFPSCIAPKAFIPAESLLICLLEDELYVSKVIDYLEIAEERGDEVTSDDVLALALIFDKERDNTSAVEKIIYDSKYEGLDEILIKYNEAKYNLDDYQKIWNGKELFKLYNEKKA